jgi:hypothetical protein
MTTDNESPDATLTAPVAPAPVESADVPSPAVTPDFPPVAGLHELLKQPGVAKVAAPAVPPAPPAPTIKVEPKLFLSTLQLLDKIASNALRVEPEPVEMLEGVAAALVPLMDYYASKGESGVALAWGNLAVALLGVGFVKYQKVEERKQQARAQLEREQQLEALRTTSPEEDRTNGKGK